MELGEVRHGLKNVLTALKSGCMLIEARLPEGESVELREFLTEMRAEIAKGTALVEQLVDVGAPPG